ncbi:pentatricopeptide repeat-containing protein At4g39530 [Selaginella moellendorffii]|nr:pentatricopeptide repeat-containing protein At4g39530 [Selaginella moellendorffii]|eukprot:XP_002987354.2 pentatricopeptide repeat-containing protein At4g39530 [Selaginella moellendorffii]
MATVLVDALKKCADVGECRRIHALAVESGQESNTFVASTLAVAYARCARMDNARRVFEGMPPSRSNLVPWTALVLGHAQAGEGDLALELFQAMLAEGCRPDSRAMVAALKACASCASRERGIKTKLEVLEKGMAIHAHWEEFHPWNVFVATCLVDLYAKCGSTADATRVFEVMPSPSRTVVSWTALITGYADNGQPMAALELFQRMLHSSCAPNELTFAAALKACSCWHGDWNWKLETGMAIHSLARARGCDTHAGVAATLVKLYATCGRVCEAYHAHSHGGAATPASWTALVRGCVDSGHWELALDFFVDSMHRAQTLTGAIVVAALLACSAIAAQEQGVATIGDGSSVKMVSLERGMAIHAAAAAAPRFERDIYVDNSLIEMYVKCGSLADALAVYTRMKARDSVTLTCLVLGCVENAQGELAMEVLRSQLRDLGRPDAQTLVAVLKACGSVGALKDGKAIHGELCRSGWEASTPALVTCLVSFYAGCGGSGMADAQLVFDSGTRPGLITWNALIAGYGCQGEAVRGLEMFWLMVEQGVVPDGATFVSLLAACNHAGLVDECDRLWSVMVFRFGIRPSMNHYQCVTNALNRASKAT